MCSPIIYRYLTIDDVETPQYRCFIEKYYGEECCLERYGRIKWYWSLGSDAFRILTACIDDEYVGQACAYRVQVSVNHNIVDFWWGIDAFVLSTMRGKGIGKQLQKRLHNDCIGFSSIWYSPINGIIKRKLGAHSILDVCFAYHPVSCYFSILAELALKRVISRKIVLPHLYLPYVYSDINHHKLKQGKAKNYVVKEMCPSVLPSLSDFIETCLKNESFYVIRSKQYMQWKYNNNPRIKYHVLSVSINDELAGLVVFSEIKVSNVVMTKARVVKIFESVFTPASGLSHDFMLAEVIDFYKNKRKKLDGVLSLQRIKYFPKFIYPRPFTELLSVLAVDKLTTGYITYSDQDME